ncbi:MAG TPA: sulfatase-like hydrolase/transferase, partial [Micromonosporaceae bacterium]
RVAVADPALAPEVGAVLDDGYRRLRAAGFDARTGLLTSSTVGGGSWLAHATMLAGTWVDNQQRYGSLPQTGRLTIGGAFRRAGWRTVAVMPGNHEPWPEASYFGYQQVYDAGDLGYRGAAFSFATMPDQYTLAAFQRMERDRAGRAPLMAEVSLISSHAPWSPVPTFTTWGEIGDGSGFSSPGGAGDPAEIVWQRDPARVRADYGRSIEYSLRSLISYVETYGDDNLVLVFLGDHQPARVVTGDGAGREVPVTIVARDPAVLRQIDGWGWDHSLKPGPHAPVWRMDTFRDRFLTAFG